MDYEEQTTEQQADQASTSEAQWQPLDFVQRRVLGVLVEKAKTTPDAYPLTLNAITTGCNQKNNRQPQTNLAAEEIEAALEQLREMRAVVEVQSGSRVPKYRHRIYEWLGVDKVEAAVMTELLLRGEQTVGELRGRAARMEPIADLNALRPILQSLIDKGLVLALTPEGRGQVITHALLPPEELDALRAQYTGQAGVAAGLTAARSPGIAPGPPRPHITLDMFNELQVEVAELRAEVARLRQQVSQISGQAEEPES